MCNGSDNEHKLRPQIAEGSERTLVPNELQHVWTQWIGIVWSLFPQHTFQPHRPTGATHPFPENQRFLYFLLLPPMAKEFFLILS